ncbi:hypothetical protein PENSUB_3659 [Penicillium subrubescens]|uniref:Uncharacterized protein n=2 Tax=Penicillium subrubescens TaxID=1316194 RepID=A0A1Q5UEE1_9EURO|nr:hypothetical protein PENSUB_3659 [Penicillium subrubescens]
MAANNTAQPTAAGQVPNGQAPSPLGTSLGNCGHRIPRPGYSSGGARLDRADRRAGGHVVHGGSTHQLDLADRGWRSRPMLRKVPVRAPFTATGVRLRAVLAGSGGSKPQHLVSKLDRDDGWRPGQAQGDEDEQVALREDYEEEEYCDDGDDDESGIKDESEWESQI